MTGIGRKFNQRGWTVIEMLAVVGIILGMLGIGLPILTGYVKRSFDARAKSDLFSAAIAQEAYYVDWDVYSVCSSATQCEAVLPNLWISKDVEMGTVTTTPHYFIMTSYHPRGSQTFTWNSDAKGLLGAD